MFTKWGIVCGQAGCGGGGVGWETIARLQICPECPGLTAVWLMSPLWPAIRLHHQAPDAISTHQTSHRDWYNDTALTRALGRCAGRAAPRRAARVPEI